MRNSPFSPSRESSPSHYSSTSPSIRSSAPPTPRHRTFSASLMEENFDIAELIIDKWDFDRSSSYNKISYLFDDDRSEAKKFLRSVRGLQAAMHFFLSYNSSSSERLVRAQFLMEIAAKRLKREFYQILCKNRSYLDPESISISSQTSQSSSRSSSFDDDEFDKDSTLSGDSISQQAASDLRSIAGLMISIGYGKECVKIYKTVRKSIVDESLYNLGVIELLSSSQMQKMEWETIELKIMKWIKSVKIAVDTIFHGERSLCDHVFAASALIAESCFSEVAREGALNLFGFPELVVKSKKLSSEKMFRVLDLYNTLWELWPDIEVIFSYSSISSAKSQALTSLMKLAEAVRSMLTDFEAAIQKESSKSPLPGGGIHPVTRYVMNYIVFLSDYQEVVTNIMEDSPITVQSPLPESYFQSPASGDGQTSAISIRLAWIILVLLCKLDTKAELYRDVSMSYLFLANNINYVVSKVRSSYLRFLIGDDWVTKHEEKVKQHLASYERMGWSKVTSSLPDLDQMASISPQAANDCFRNFNTALEEAYRKQGSSNVPDTDLREDIKASLANKIVPAYRTFYNKYRAMFRGVAGAESIVRYAPEDVENYLWGLFSGKTVSASDMLSSPAASPSSSSSDARQRRVR